MEFITDITKKIRNQEHAFGLKNQDFEIMKVHVAVAALVIVSAN